MAQRKKAAKKKVAARKPEPAPEPNPELVALRKHRRDELRVTQEFVRERVRAQEARLARIREQAAPPPKLVVPGD